MIGEFLYWCVRVTRFLKSAVVNLANKSQCLCGEGVKFTSTSKVYNIIKDPNKIRLMNRVVIKGELLVFGYGGDIEIGRNSYLSHGSRIWSGDKVLIGDNVLISHNVNIVDTNSHELNSNERQSGYENLLEFGHPTEKGAILTSPIVIKDNVWISFNATILKGVTIGTGSIIAANSVVTKDVPPYTLVAGNPAKFIRNTN